MLEKAEVGNVGKVEVAVAWAVECSAVVNVVWMLQVLSLGGLPAARCVVRCPSGLSTSSGAWSGCRMRVID